MRPRYISSELFHFVGSAAPHDNEHNYALLKTVLSAGCVSHPPHDVGWGTVSYSLDLSKSLAREEMLVPTVTCYCDIPYEQLGPHMSKYGQFGLSFSRHHLTQVGGRPVIYVPCRSDDWKGAFTGHTLLSELKATFQGVRKQRSALELSTGRHSNRHALGQVATSAFEALAKAEHTLALRILAFVKPYESTLDEADPNYYYSEREWRKLGNLVFEPKEVLRVVVSPSFVQRAIDELPTFAGKIYSAPT